MTRRLAKSFAALAVLLGVVPCSADAADVWVMELDGAIGPATASYFIRTLHRAQDAGAAALIVELDTPGGLDQAMRDMIKEILAAQIPVVTYVSPNGSRAASAGTYLMYASHIAAMAPATNIGSSTPVQIGGSPFPSPTSSDPSSNEEPGDSGEPAPPSGAMERKIVNDAVAYIKGLAALRGRNQEWAEKTVREASNLTANEALDSRVIDLVAADLDELLTALDGRTIELSGGAVTLDLAQPRIERITPGLRDEILALITEPNVAYILLMLGVYGLLLEFYNPGFGVPGITGAICLLLAAYALQMLPVNYAGLALIIVGIGLIVAELVTPTVGVLGVGGGISFIAGSLLLFDSELPAYRLSLPLVAAVAMATFGVLVLGVGAALRARRLRVATGPEAMIGAPAVALEDFTSQGIVRAFSETWTARSERPVHKGEALRVVGVDGLVLRVKGEE